MEINEALNVLNFTSYQVILKGNSNLKRSFDEKLGVNNFCST
jgi:hypothetical protein